MSVDCVAAGKKASTGKVGHLLSKLKYEITYTHICIGAIYNICLFGWNHMVSQLKFFSEAPDKPI